MRRERNHALKCLEMPTFMHDVETVLLRDRGDQQVRQRDTMMKRAELGKAPLRRHRSSLNRGGERDVTQRGKTLLQRHKRRGIARREEKPVSDRQAGVLLALEGFNKKTQKTPPASIQLAQRRLSDWRRRGAAQRASQGKPPLSR